MLTEEIMERYELARDWRSAGFYETENHAQIAHAVRSGLTSGRLIAITGPVGIGKTAYLHRMQDEIAKERKVIVAGSLSVDKMRATVPTLVAALFYDLSRQKGAENPDTGREARTRVTEAGGARRQAGRPVRRRGPRSAW